jgi:predicted amidohydrolase
LIEGDQYMSHTIKSAAVQFNHRPGDKEYNLERIEKICHEAANEGCQLIAFPEMCITGYWHVRNLSVEEVDSLAETIAEGESIRRLQLLSIKLNMIIGVGFIEKDDCHFYNSYAVFQPDRPTSCHRKLHCFVSEHMSSGDSYTIIDTSLNVKLGVLICFDNNIVENSRITAMMGADIILAPHQTGGVKTSNPSFMGGIDVSIWENRFNNPDKVKEEFTGKKGRGWLRRWLHSRAHDNGVFYMFSNGVGVDDDEVRTGNAMIIDCNGEIVAESTSIEDDVIYGEINTNLFQSCLGRIWMKGRRPELYTLLVAENESINSWKLKKLEQNG